MMSFLAILLSSLRSVFFAFFIIFAVLGCSGGGTGSSSDTPPSYSDDVSGPDDNSDIPDDNSDDSDDNIDDNDNSDDSDSSDAGDAEDNSDDNDDSGNSDDNSDDGDDSDDSGGNSDDDDDSDDSGDNSDDGDDSDGSGDNSDDDGDSDDSGDNSDDDDDSDDNGDNSDDDDDSDDSGDDSDNNGSDDEGVLFTVRFLDPEGNLLDSREYNEGYQLTLPEVQKEHWDFLYWKVGDQRVEGTEYTINEDTDFVAEYVRKQYKVAFAATIDNKRYLPLSDERVNYPSETPGREIKLPTPPEHYEFNHWELHKVRIDIDTFILLEDDVNFVMVCELKNYNVTFYEEDGETPIRSEIYPALSSADEMILTFLDPSSVDGYVFQGWLVEGALIDDSFQLTGDTDFIAYYTALPNPPDQYDVSFYNDKLDLILRVTAPAGSTIGDALNSYSGDPSNLSDEWYKAGGNDRIYKSDVIAENGRYYAVYDVIEISDEAGLKDITGITCGDNKKKYILVEDIVLDGQWTPLCSNSPSANRFKGLLNGDFHTISNLWIDESVDYAGLFRYIGTGGEVRNLYIKTAPESEKGIRGKRYVGTVAGEVSSAKINNVCSTGYISGSESVGGIAGQFLSGGIVKNSCFYGNINGNMKVGGIAGYLNENSLIANSYTLGTVTGNESIGGIAGSVTSGSTIKYSYSTAEIIGGNIAGGILGQIDKYMIQGCLAVNTFINVGEQIHRIAGVIGNPDGDGINNFALDTLPESFDIDSAQEHGENVTAEALQEQPTYEIMGWQFGDSEDSPWRLPSEGEGNYPLMYWESAE
jgi:hypothetical protein